MIQQDQPGQFPQSFTVALSSKSDGTMLDRSITTHDTSAVGNRVKFCQLAGLSYGDAAYQDIVYGDDQTYDKIVTVDRSHTTAHLPDVNADALFTKIPEVGLFLPVADCVATVICDPVNRYLAMVHLGRDSTVASLMQKTLKTFSAEGSNLADVIIWMSPSAKKETYFMQWFDHEADPGWQDFIQKTDQGIHLDLSGYNRAAALGAGVLAGNIHISPINTMTSDNYFSHSMGDTTGRFAVVASMNSV